MVNTCMKSVIHAWKGESLHEKVNHRLKGECYRKKVIHKRRGEIIDEKVNNQWKVNHRGKVDS